MAYSNYGYAPGGNIGSSLPRQVEYIGLKDYPSIQFVDTSITSDNFFNIVEFPDKLTSGKNIIKLRASANTLVKDSKIHVEVLDFNGDPIYFEPLDYFEPDGTRVISIWVDAETVPGLARVYLAGRTKANPNTGQSIESSKNFNSPNFLNIPNVIWSRSLTVQPQSLNKTEIIFDPENPPQLTVSETRLPLHAPLAITQTDEITSEVDAITKRSPTVGGELTITTQKIHWVNAELSPAWNPWVNMLSPGLDQSYIYFHEEDTANKQNFSPYQPINSLTPFVKLETTKPFFTEYMQGGTLRVQNAHVNITQDDVISFPFAMSGSVAQTGEVIPNALLVPAGQVTKHYGGTDKARVNITEDSMPVSWSNDDGNFQQISQTYGDEFYTEFYWTGYNGTGGSYTGQNAIPLVPQNIRDTAIFPGDPGPTSHFQISGSSVFIIMGVHNETIAYGQFLPVPSYINGETLADGYTAPADRSDAELGGFYFQAAVLRPNEPNINGPEETRKWNRNNEAGQIDTKAITNAYAQNFTASYLGSETSYVTYEVEGEPLGLANPLRLTQSFADIFIKNLEPLSGDVHSVRTLYKPGGMFGDFMHAGDTRVEAQEVFYSTSSLEGSAFDGIHYRRPGFFKAGDVSASIQLTQWNTGNTKLLYADTGLGIVALSPFLTDAPYELSASFNNTNLLSGVTLRTLNNIAYGDSGISNAAFEPFGRFIYTGFLPDNQQWYKNQLYFEADTTYELSFKAYSTDLIGNTDDANIRVPRLDVYINSFATLNENKIQATTITVPETQADKYRYDLGIAYADTFKYIDGEFFTISMPPADWSERHGQHIIAVEGYESSSLNVSAIFQANEDFRGVPSFIIRQGEWTLSDISIKTVKETGYTPNSTRIRLKVPTEHRNIPLSFKFQYLNYLGEPADLQSTIAPITFNGTNFLLSGEDNLLTGSLFISNTVGSGLELAGVNSGFLRSIGYTGFISASRTDLPGGFLMYSGSVLPNAPDSYNGVGLELVRDSASFFRFNTDGVDAGLEIQTDRFFLGSETAQFISGSGGNIEISSSNFRLSPEGNVTASNMLLTGTARADAFEFKEVTIDKDNSGSFLSTFTDGLGDTFYDLKLTESTAMFFRLDDPFLYPIGKITPATTTGYAHQVFIESAHADGHYFALPLVSSGTTVEIVADDGDLFAESFKTVTINGTEYQSALKLDTGARAMLIRSKFDWKIQSLNDYKGVTASFGAVHFDNDTTMVSANVDGGSF